MEPLADDEIPALPMRRRRGRRIVVTGDVWLSGEELMRTTKRGEESVWRSLGAPAGAHAPGEDGRRWQRQQVGEEAFAQRGDPWMVCEAIEA